MAGSLHLLIAFAVVLVSLFAEGNAQCYSNPTCAGPAILGLSPMDCCLGEGLSYGEPGDCQICYLIGYTPESRVLTLDEGDTDSLVVAVLKPPAGIDEGITINFQIDNSANTIDVGVGGASTPTGMVFTGSFRRMVGFRIRAETDQIGQEGVEVFTIPLLFTSDDLSVDVFVQGPATVTVNDRSIVRVSLTEADYQRREGQGGNVIVASVAYDRDLANDVTVTFFPVTYMEYARRGFTLPSGFPTRPDGSEFEARESDFVGAPITITIPRPGGGTNRQVMLEVPFIDDNINEHEETFVGYIEIESAIDESILTFARTATQLIINDNDEIVIGFTEDTYTFTEGLSGAAITLAKDSGVLSERNDIVVTVSLTGQPTATQGSDFQVTLLDTDIRFGPDDVTVDIPLSILEDQLPEGLESFSLLVEDVGFPFNTPRINTFEVTQVVIRDNDDVVVGLEMTAYTVEERDRSLEVCARVTSPPDNQPLPRQFQLAANTLPSTADTGDDFGEVAIVLPFDDTNRRRCFDIEIVEDGVFEIDETFLVVTALFSGDRVTVEPGGATITIIDMDAVTIGVQQGSYTVQEDVGFATVCAEVVEGVVGRDTDIILSTGDNTAEEMDDYLETIQRLTFNDGSTQACTGIQIINDQTLEDLEDFRIRLETAVERVNLAPAEGSVVIVDDDVVTVGFVMPMYRVDENGQRVELCAEILSGQADANFIANLDTVDNTAVAGSDFTALQNAELNFVVPSTTACTFVDITNDQLYETDETFFGVLTSDDPRVLINANRAQTTVTITDEDSLTIGFAPESVSVRVLEGDPARLCAEVLSGNLGRDVSVDFSTRDGTAESGDDYESTNQQFNFNPDTLQVCVDVATVEDMVFETPEQFLAFLAGELDRLTIAPDQATVNIEDDDDIMAVIGFVEPSYRVVEGEGNVIVEVELISGNIPAGNEVEITLTTDAGTATETSDYTRRQVVLTFSDDNPTRSVSIPIRDDSDIEDVETFLARLEVDSAAFPAVTVDPSITTVSIISNDILIGFAQTEVTVPETDAGLGLDLQVLEGVIAPELGDIVVRVDTQDRTATDMQDYLGVESQEFTFNSNNDGFSFGVAILDDSDIEGTEQFVTTATLVSDHSGVVLRPSQVVIDITDDDVVIGFNPEDYSVDENDGTVQVFVSVLQGSIPAGETRRVTISTEDGTAGAPSDYTSLSDTLTFSSASPSDSVTITIADDTTVEDLERFMATLRVDQPALNPGITLDPDTAFIDIRDDDVVIGFSERTTSVREANDATLFVTVRDGTILSGEEYIVTVTTSGDTATEGSDYAAVTRELTFTSTIVNIPVTVQTVADTEVEGTETFTAELSVDNSLFPNVNLDPDTSEVFILDDDVVIGLENTAYTVDEGNTVAINVQLLEGEITQTTIVTLSTEGNTAQSPDDYRDVNIDVTFRPGTLVQPVIVRTINDVNVEDTEQFVATLSVDNLRFPGVTIRPGTGTVDIVDSDTLRVVLNSSEYRVNENEGPLEVCVRLQPEDVLQRPLEVTFSTTDGTAITGTDYTDTALTLNFDEGTNELCRDIPILDDDVTEPREETFVVTIDSDDPLVTVGPPNQADVIIVDNDRVRIGFELTEYEVVEDEDSVMMVVEVLEGELSGPVEIDLATEDFTATSTSPADYSSTAEILTFDSTTTRMVVAIPIEDDDIVEDIETFFSRLSLLDTELDVTVDPDLTEIRITDEGDVVEIALEQISYGVDEADGPVEVCVVIVSGTLEREASVEVELSDISAGSTGTNSDYISETLTFTFNEGVDRLCDNIPINDDDDLEEDEEFGLRLTSDDPDVSVVDPSDVPVSIFNDDDVVLSFEFPMYTVLENQMENVCVIVIDGGFQISVSVTVLSQDGSATSTAPIDYSVTGSLLTFQPGQTSQCVQVTATDDDIDENDEDFTMTLTTSQDNVNIGLGDTQVTIVDLDDIVIGFERTEVDVFETDGMVELCAVIIDGSLERSVDVVISTQPGTAEAGVDFSSVRGTTFRFSESSPTSRCVDIPIAMDDVLEDDESFTAILVDIPSEGIVLEPDTATVTIRDETEAIFGFESVMYSGTEGTTVVTFVVLLPPTTLDTPVTLTVTSEDIDATDSVDYETVDTQLVFEPGGPGRLPVPVVLIADGLLEGTGTEQLRLRLDTEAPRVNFNPETTIVNIIDEGEVVIGLESPPYSVGEGDGDVEVCARIIEGSVDRDVFVTLETSPATATATGSGVDYTTASVELTFNAGIDRTCTNISINDDNFDEDNEMFEVALSTRDTDISIAPGRSTVTIIDNDVVSISLEDTGSVREDVGTVEVCAAIVGDATLQRTVRVTLATSPNTATAPMDYSTVEETLMFDASNPRQCVDIPIQEDDVYENDEDFTVRLTSPDDDVILVEDEGTITIEDTSVIVIGLEMTQYTADESDDSVRVCTLLQSGTIDEDVTIPILFTSGDPGTATAGVDYAAGSLTLEFNSTVISVCVIVGINSDDIVEEDETFTVDLTDDIPRVIVQPANGEVVIRDDDVATPEFELPEYRVPEPDGPVEVCLTIPAGQLERDVVVLLVTSDITATGGVDYGDDSINVEFPAGSTRMCVNISITDDSIPESEEGFEVDVGPGPDVSPTPVMTTVLILDNDVVIGFDPEMYFTDEDAGQVLVNVSVLQGEVRNTIRLRFLTQDGSAQAPDDYAAVNRVITFEPGTSSLSVPITINEDVIDEPQETILVDLALDTSDFDDVQLDPDRAVVNIVSVGAVQIGFERSVYQVQEEDGEVTVFVMILNGELTSDVEIAFTTENDSASALDDYTPLTRILTFGPSTTRLPVVIDINNDNIVESTENFFANLMLVSVGANIVVTPDRARIIIRDRDAITPEFELPEYNVPEPDGPVEVCVIVPAGQLDRRVDISLLARDRTATGNVDFRPTSFDLVFEAGSTRMCINIVIVDDRIPEDNETFIVEMIATPEVDPGPETTVTIRDNDVVIGFERTDYTVGETDGQVNLVVRVLEGRVSDLVRLRLTTRNGAAFAPGDYISVDELLTFEPGVTTIQVPISITEDNVNENRERFFADLALESVAGNDDVIVVPSFAAVDIVDVAPAVIGFEDEAYTVAEEDGNVQVFVTLMRGELTGDVTIQFATEEGTATSSDYASTEIDLIFGPGRSTRQQVIIDITDDGIDEDVEDFFANLVLGTPGANVIVDPDRAEILIIDNDVFTPEFELPEYTIPENDGPVTVCITIPDGQLDRDVVAGFNTVDGTARQNEDYSPLSIMVTFERGTTRECRLVPIIDDSDPEDNEPFTVQLNVPEGPTILTTVLIIDDDEVCPQLLPIRNGGVSLTGRQPGDTARYFCNPGFVLGGEPTRICTQLDPNTADWSGEEPVCQPLCDPLSDPGFGTVTLSGTEIGDTAMYQCVSGFVLDGPEIRTCNQLTPGVADWSEDAPVCIPLCDGLSAPAFGSVSLTGRQIGDVATYQCNTGFVLDGPEIRTCNQLTPGVADWSEDAPVCIPLCDNLSAPAFGSVSLMGRQIGDVATYQCNTGFELDGPEIRTCNQLTPGVADWAPGEPLCRPICDNLADPPFGSVSQTGRSVESTATYQCDPGFELVGPPTRTCEQFNDRTADWSGEEPVCRPLCDNLPDPSFGNVSLSGNSIGDVATYACNPGFDLVGPPTRTCEEMDAGFADWSGEAPVCRPECDDLQDPPFGTVTQSGVSVGSTATYQCDPGFGLIGPSTRICEELDSGSADWSGEEPICERVTVEFERPSYTFTENGVTGTIVVVKSGIPSSPFTVRVTGGPSNQPNIERSAEGIDQLVTFSSDPEAPDRMTVSFTLTDDEVALEPVEAYIARLTVESATSGVVVGEVDRTRINVLDDDTVTVGFGRPEAGFNESDGAYRMCIVKDRVTAQRVTVALSDTPGTAQRDEDYRSVPLRLIAIEPDEDRTCFGGDIIDDLVGAEGVESFTLHIGEPTQPGVTIGLNITTIRIIDDDIITVVMVRPVQTVPERNGEVRVCARKDIVTAGPVSANIATFSNKAIAGEDFNGGEFSFSFGTEANTVGCLLIGIIVDDIYEDVEDFDTSLTPGDNVNVMVGPQDTTVVLIDDLAADIVNDTLIGDPLLTVPLQEQSLAAVSDISEASLCYEIHGAEDTWFNILSDGCVSVNAHYFRFNQYFNFVDKIAIRAVDEQGICKDILIELEGCTTTVNGALVPTTTPYCADGVFVRPSTRGNRVRVSVPNCNETSNLVMWTLCQRNVVDDPFDMMRSYTVDMIKFVIARGFNLGASSHGLIGQFWNIPINVAIYNGPATDSDAGQRYIIQVEHPESEPRVFTGLLAGYSWEEDDNNCFYVGNRQGGTIREVDDPNDSVIEGTYRDYQTGGDFNTAFKFSHFDDNRCL